MPDNFEGEKEKEKPLTLQTSCMSKCTTFIAPNIRWEDGRIAARLEERETLFVRLRVSVLMN